MFPFDDVIMVIDFAHILSFRNIVIIGSITMVPLEQVYDCPSMYEANLTNLGK